MNALILLASAIETAKVLADSGRPYYVFYESEAKRAYVGLAEFELATTDGGQVVRRDSSGVTETGDDFFDILQSEGRRGFFLIADFDPKTAPRPPQAVYLVPEFELCIGTDGVEVSAPPVRSSVTFEAAVSGARARPNALTPPKRVESNTSAWKSESAEAFEIRLRRAIELVRGREGKLIVTRPFSRRIDGGRNLVDLFALLGAAEPNSAALHLVRGSESSSLGASPENVVELERGRLVLDAVAGTRAVFSDPESDAEAEQELLNSQKERREHAMALTRAMATLQRWGVPGSSSTIFERRLRTFRGVRHLHSRVGAKARPALDCFSLLKACFPALASYPPDIARLADPNPVGPHYYGGLVGRVDGAGGLKAFLNLRGLELRGSELLAQAGVGIVDGSSVEGETNEVFSKLSSLYEVVTLWLSQ